MRIEVIKHINAPLGETFKAFSRFEDMQDILEGIARIEFLSDGTTGIGTRWRETRIMFGRESTEEMEVTEIVENSHYKVEAESNSVKYESTYSFTESNGGTSVTLIFMGKPQTFIASIQGSILGIFVRGMTRKALEKDIDDIKAYLEQKTLAR